MKYENERNIFEEAQIAAQKALRNAKPTPVTFGVAKNLTSNEIVPGTEETWDEGVCGFAWIKVSGRGRFANFLKEAQIGRKCGYGGLRISSLDMSGYNGQSLERKETAMEAASEVLSKYGIKNSVQSRMD